MLAPSPPVAALGKRVAAPGHELASAQPRWARRLIVTLARNDGNDQPRVTRMFVGVVIVEWADETPGLTPGQSPEEFWRLRRFVGTPSGQRAP